MKVWKLIILVNLLFLTSCSTSYQSSFDCRAGKGMGCKSVSEINSHLNKGKIFEGKQLRIWVAPNHELGELEGSYQYLDKVEISE